MKIIKYIKKVYSKIINIKMTQKIQGLIILCNNIIISQNINNNNKNRKYPTNEISKKVQTFFNHLIKWEQIVEIIGDYIPLNVYSTLILFLTIL